MNAANTSATSAQNVESKLQLAIDPEAAALGYANPAALVSTKWVKENLGKPGVKVIEVDVDPKLYAAGHIAGAIGWDWNKDLQDPVRRDIPSQEAWEALLSRSGVEPADTIVFYGDASNWFAAFAVWVAKYYGHEDVRLMNGGRIKWLGEDDKAMTTEVPAVRPSAYRVSRVQRELRTRLMEVLTGLAKPGQTRPKLIDVRSADEFSGKVIAPAGMSETAQRGGHIPGATNVPWGQAVNPDGTFKSRAELEALYGLREGEAVVTYCRIGERSSHTWFVLSHLLGLSKVSNYDGSWTEYGSVIGVPIEKGS